MRRFAIFAMVGGTGFVVDAAVLLLLLRGGWADPFTARLVAIFVAMSVTWALNRTVTFGPSGRHPAAEGLRYGSVGLAASGVNYAVYALALILVPTLSPLAALVVGSAAAMVFSYLGFARLVFRRPS
jgi:putative flippase GtrA